MLNTCNNVVSVDVKHAIRQLRPETYRNGAQTELEHRGG
jgi:hypothetical protein